MKVTVNKYLFFTFVGSTTFMEFIQFLFYEEHITFLGIDLLFMSFVGLFLCYWKRILLLTILTIFEVTETVSFMVIGNGLDFQTINNIDMGFAVNVFKYYVVVAVAACVLIYIGFKYVYSCTEGNKKLANSKNITISLSVLALLFLGVISFSLFYIKEYYTFFPFFSPFNKHGSEEIIGPVIEEEMLKDMDVSLNTKLNITKVPDVKRNLILIPMESIEALCVGRFNPKARYMMPFVSNVSEVSPTFLGETQKLTDYSVAAMFAAMCCYPYINTPSLKGNGSPIYKTKKVKCVWDYLKAAGYKMHACANRWAFAVGHMGRLMRMHGVTLEIERKFTNDFDVVNNSLTRIKRLIEKRKPFMYTILNVNTHYPYTDDPKCNSDHNTYKARRVINCLDYDLKLLFDEFVRMKIWETTDIVLYGDHLNFWKLKFYKNQKRKTFLTFPKLQDLGKGAAIEPKQYVIYDIGPSILDMLGFEYTPKYPFGRSLFKPGYEKRVPSSVHIKHFYEVVKGEKQKKMNENTHTTVEQLRERLDANNRNRIAAQKDLDNVCAATEKEIDDMRVKLQNELINVAKKDCEKIQDLIAKAEEGNLTQESCTSVLYTCHVYKVTSSTPRLLRLEVARVSRPHKKGTDLVAELQKAEAEQDDKRASAAEEIDEKCNKLIAEVRMLQYQVNHEVEVAYNAEDARLQALLSRITNSIGSDAVAALNAGKVGLVVWRKYFLVKNPSAEVVGDLCKLETTVSVWEFEKRMASNISISKIENGKIYLAFEGPFNSEELDVMKAHGVIKEEGSGNGNEAVMMVAALAEGDFSSDESVEQCFETFVIDPNGKTIIPGTLRAEAVYTLKVRAELNGMKGNWSTPVLFSTPAFSVCCVWRECPQKMDKNVRYELDPDNPRVAIRKSNYKQAIAVFGAVSFPVNKVISMAIKICCGGSNVVVGVMQSDVDQCYSTNLWIYEMFGWHFNCFDSTLCSGPPHCYWGKPYGPESCMITGVVGLVMDTVKGELSFYVNGVSYGVAYDGIPLDKPLIPSVVMSGYNNSVELKFIENIPNKVNSGIPVPLGLEGKRKGHDTIELWWEKNESIHFYQIETNGAKLLDATKSASFTKCMLLPGTDYKFRIRAVRDKDVSEWSDTVTVRTKEPRPFSKCKWRKYPGHDENGYVRSKLNHRLVKCVSYDTPCAVIGTAPLPLNKVVHWSIRVVNVYKEFGYGDKMCIGVAPMDINLLSSNVSMKCGWYIYCYSATLFSGPPQCYASKRYWAKTDPKDDESVGYYVRPDKSIVVTMDTTTGTLSFTKPYSDYGSEPAFEGIPLDKPLTPCVIFGHRGDELELVIPKTE